MPEEQTRPDESICDNYLRDTDGNPIQDRFYYTLRTPGHGVIRTALRLHVGRFVEDLVVDPVDMKHNDPQNDRFYITDKFWHNQGVVALRIKIARDDIRRFVNPGSSGNCVAAKFHQRARENESTGMVFTRGQRLNGKNYIGDLREDRRTYFSLGSYNWGERLSAINATCSEDLTFEVEFVNMGEN